eukprot:scaffold657436_cov59-Prasinocladus_malaysianus.AAC.3
MLPALIGNTSPPRIGAPTKRATQRIHASCPLQEAHVASNTITQGDWSRGQWTIATWSRGVDAFNELHCPLLDVLDSGRSAMLLLEVQEPLEKELKSMTSTKYLILFSGHLLVAMVLSMRAAARQPYY